MRYLWIVALLVACDTAPTGPRLEPEAEAIEVEEKKEGHSHPGPHRPPWQPPVVVWPARGNA